MRSVGTFVGVVALISKLLLFPASGTAQDSMVQSCTLPFEATVGTGPNAGFAMSGDLVFEIAEDGQVPQGWLIRETDAAVPVTGQITGRSIGLIFDLGDGGVLFGTGIADGEMMACDGLWEGDLGGPFAGPESGDLGDWRRKGKPGKGLLQITEDGTVINEEGEVALDDGCIDDPTACVN